MQFDKLVSQFSNVELQMQYRCTKTAILNSKHGLRVVFLHYMKTATA